MPPGVKGMSNSGRRIQTTVSAASDTVSALFSPNVWNGLKLTCDMRKSRQKSASSEYFLCRCRQARRDTQSLRGAFIGASENYSERHQNGSPTNDDQFPANENASTTAAILEKPDQKNQRGRYISLRIP